MAMSFARPDPSSPASVADASFGTSRRGFDQTEVRDFLRMIAAELGRLQERERFLERELRTAQSNPDLESVQFDEQTLTRLLGEETARVLTTARESAAEIRAKAEQSAAQLLSEAGDEAARMREEAEVEAARRRADAGADAEAELSMAKQQGREMVNEARAYRERVLSELARRRELAREQIEQLIHGRDRLMQSFERARLVAVDVVSELTPLGEPDEYVNLAPTTGPVPVMVPNGPRVVEQEPMADADPAEEAEPVADAVDEIAPVEHAEADEPEPEIVDEVDQGEGVDDVAEPEDAERDVAEGDVAEAEASEEDVVDDVGEPDLDDAETADAETTETIDAVTADDDVVVDLFARLRASTEVDVAEDEPSAVDDTDIADDTDTDIAADTDSAATDEAAAGEDAADEAAAPTPFEQRDADLTPVIVASAKKLKRVLADEQNEVLDALRRSESVRHLDTLLPWSNEHAGRYREAIAADLLAAAQAGAASVVAANGKPTKLRKADAARASTAADEVLEEWLVTPLRERLERCVAEGGGDNADVAKRARAVYREWKTQHIDEQLDDVIRTAHGRGVLAAIEPGAGVRWVADDGQRICADCDDNTLAGAVPAGSEFPTGHVAAPAHLGCRCILIPDAR